MTAGLRETLRQLLDEVCCTRPPALRRSGEEDWLFATDLPQAASPEAVEAFRRAAEEADWRIGERPGWLLLDHDVIPPEGTFGASAEGETGCCLSLLLRHPGGSSTEKERRALYKASEQRDGLPRLMAAWHRDWAERLRRGEALPADLGCWIAALAHEEEKA